MVAIIIISESRAAHEMVKTVKRILGKTKIKGIFPLTIRSNANTRTLQAKINRLIKKINPDQGVIIMSELYGSTQSNVCRNFLHHNQIEMVCSYNLPMILKAATINELGDFHTVLKAIITAGKNHIKAHK